MSDKQPVFPLPFAALSTKKEGATKGAYVATPQTATRNAATRQTAPPQVVAGPSRAHAQAQQRQAQPDVSSRSDLLVSDAVRRAMVARLVRQGIEDRVVLDAMQAVPRHGFVQAGLASQAYSDTALPIGHHQTISQPYIVARMIELLRHDGPLQRVLEIGTGCGYQAAVLAQVAQEVYSIERIKALHELARVNLRPLRIAHLRLQYGDGMLGLPQVAPFDGIILAAAGLEVPQALLEQLSIGGRLVAPVGARMQHLQLISRLGIKQWSSTILEDCHFVPLQPGTM